MACLEVFTSGPANQASDGAHEMPEASPPTRAVRAKRALRSAPVMLVRGVWVPAYAETGASLVALHGVRMLPGRGGGDAGRRPRLVQFPAPRTPPHRVTAVRASSRAGLTLRPLVRGDPAVRCGGGLSSARSGRAPGQVRCPMADTQRDQRRRSLPDKCPRPARAMPAIIAPMRASP